MRVALVLAGLPLRTSVIAHDADVFLLTAVTPEEQAEHALVKSSLQRLQPGIDALQRAAECARANDSEPVTTTAAAGLAALAAGQASKLGAALADSMKRTKVDSRQVLAAIESHHAHA